ncbi:MAG: RloB family protein [Balneolales bacterium]|nr:RloB family protein [Balneolales bacterium]
MSRRRKSKGKRINPTYWVFCEGLTEKAYVSFLRSKYRLPIEIIPKVSGSNITDTFIKKSKQGKPTHPKDKDFLLYDGDVSETIEQLNKVKDVKLILSTPSIELWFLYHYKNQKAHISTDECI